MDATVVPDWPFTSRNAKAVSSRTTDAAAAGRNCQGSEYGGFLGGGAGAASGVGSAGIGVVSAGGAGGDSAGAD